MVAATPEAFKLMHGGAMALSAVEDAGIRIDVNLLKETMSSVKERITTLENQIRSDALYDHWRKKYGVKANIGSRDQLGSILFEDLKYQNEKRTAGGGIRVAKDTLEKVDHPVARLFIEVEMQKKLYGTYLKGILDELEGEFLRPSFNLHTAVTFRGSCDSPNFQNIPIRNKDIGKLIRSLFIPRDGHVLVEVDFSGIEVCVAACYHKDPTMIDYITTGHDLHHDVARQCFKLEAGQVTKDARFYAKNRFTFAEFYGDWYVSIAPMLWEAIEDAKLTTSDGVGLYEHLAKKGITSLGDCNSKRPPQPGTFEKHIKAVEDDFWNRRFPVYATWKQQWHDAYVKNGGFTTLTGFKVEGVYSRNQVINNPIQGSAFHCTLWSLIQIVQWLSRSRMRSRVIGQIHDSIIADVHVEELDDYLKKIKQVTTVDIRKTWDWIIVPFKVEAEAAPPGKSWFEKKKVEL